jgi:hypothetical protein
MYWMREMSMSDSKQRSVSDHVKTHGGLLGIGAAIGAASSQPLTCRHLTGDPRNPGLALQIGSAMGASAAKGGGMNGAMAAGAAVVTAKVVAATAVATAAAPVVAAGAVIGAVGYGIYKLFKS